MLKRNIYILYFISFLQGMVFYAPVATLYRQAQGVTIFQITFIESISLVLCMAMELPWGILADKIGYKKTIVVCNIIYFLSKIVFWKAEGFLGFFLERIMLSVVCAGLSGVDSSILYLSSKKGNSQKVFGIYEGLGTAGLLSTSFVYSVFIKDNYAMSGFLTVVSYAIAMILSLFLIEVKKEERHKDSFKDFKGFLKETFKNKRFFLFLLAIALFNETHQTFTVFLSQLQYVRAGIGNSVMGVLYGLITIVALCGVFSDWITKKMGEKKTMKMCFLAAILSCMMLAVTRSGALSVICILVFRMAHSISLPLQKELQNRQVKTEDRATALSVNAVFMDSVGVGTNVIFGALAQYSLVVAFGAGAMICLVAWVLYERGL